LPTVLRIDQLTAFIDYEVITNGYFDTDKCLLTIRRVFNGTDFAPSMGCTVAISWHICLPPHDRKGLTSSLYVAPAALCLSTLLASILSKPNSATVIAKSTQESTIIAASPSLFQYEVANSRVVLLDLDINMHKSNSTFLTDADISRAALLTKLLSPSLARLGPASFVLAAVQCNFKRPIAPWQAYRVSSRILAWDERSLYLVTYFTKPDTKKLQTGLDLCGGPAAVFKDKVVSKGLFVTLVTRYVFKAGRTTVRPVHILLEAGLLLSGDGGGEASALGVAEVREGVERGLEYARNSMV
jgi:acyl-CoA thioesterase FadM